MANKALFSSFAGRLAKLTDTTNHHGAPAYALSREGALAQLAATGALNQTFYAGAGEQLDQVLELCVDVDPEFVAKVAIYSRERGHMKDMPALLLAYLAAFDIDLFDIVFDRIIDNGRMLRTFVQILRSGVTGRRSFGSRIKRKVREYLDNSTDEALFRMSVGNAPSLADIIKMVHPRPRDEARAALYGYFLDKPVEDARLPPLVQKFEAFKTDGNDVPDVPFQMLTGLDLERRHWIQIARRAGWQMTRMNLNTFKRHGVFEDAGVTSEIAARLSNPALVKKARVFPYQLLAAYVMAEDIPLKVRRALEKALEVSIENVPAFKGRVVIAPDVSGSMQSPATGWRAGATTSVRCVDVAGLMAAAVLRHNPRARVLPFEHKVVALELNGKDSVLANAAKLASIGGGGTSCSAPLTVLNQERAKVDLFVMVSDNESWRDTRGDRKTETLRQWDLLKRRNPRAKMVCLDMQPYTTVQAHEREDILHVGGFSDEVFEVIASFARAGTESGHWRSVIDAVALGHATAA